MVKVSLGVYAVTAELTSQTDDEPVQVNAKKVESAFRRIREQVEGQLPLTSFQVTTDPPNANLNAKSEAVPSPIAPGIIAAAAAGGVVFLIVILFFACKMRKKKVKMNTSISPDPVVPIIKNADSHHPLINMALAPIQAVHDPTLAPIQAVHDPMTAHLQSIHTEGTGSGSGKKTVLPPLSRVPT